MYPKNPKSRIRNKKSVQLDMVGVKEALEENYLLLNYSLYE
jgi:hypothetical protein